MSTTTSTLRSPRRARRSRKTYTPDAEAKEVYDRVYAIYRTLYESLGVTDVSLLHGLKRIRAESGAA